MIVQNVFEIFLNLLHAMKIIFDKFGIFKAKPEKYTVPN